MHEKINLLETPGRSGISNASVLEILTFVALPPGHRLWASSWRSLPCPSHHGPSTESDWSTAPLENSLKEKKKAWLLSRDNNEEKGRRQSWKRGKHGGETKDGKINRRRGKGNYGTKMNTLPTGLAKKINLEHSQNNLPQHIE